MKYCQVKKLTSLSPDKSQTLLNSEPITHFPGIIRPTTDAPADHVSFTASLAGFFREARGGLDELAGLFDVYLAYHTRFGWPVALKILQAKYVQEDDLAGQVQAQLELVSKQAEGDRAGQEKVRELSLAFMKAMFEGRHALGFGEPFP